MHTNISYSKSLIKNSMVFGHCLHFALHFQNQYRKRKIAKCLGFKMTISIWAYQFTLVLGIFLSTYTKPLLQIIEKICILILTNFNVSVAGVAGTLNNFY